MVPRSRPAWLTRIGSFVDEGKVWGGPAVVGLKVGRNGVAALETEIVAHRRSTFRARIVFNSLLGVKRARALTALGVKQPFHYKGHTKE